MSRDLKAVNEELLALTEAYAGGSLAAAEFRQRRRLLICQVTGEPEPALDSGASAESTHPGIAALSDSEVAAASTQAAPAATKEAAPPSRRALYWGLTVVLVLVALAGVGGLIWFVSRHG